MSNHISPIQEPEYRNTTSTNPVEEQKPIKVPLDEFARQYFELFDRITKYLSPKDLMNLSSVSKYFFDPSFRYPHIAECIIKQISTYKEELFADANKVAEALDMLKRTGCPLSTEARSDAVGTALLRTNIPLLELFVDDGPISDWRRGGVLCAFLGMKNKEDLAKRLLDSGPISEDHRNQALVMATQGGHLDIVQTLLASGTIHDNARGGAVMRAAESGYLDILQMLLDSGIIYDDARGRAVESAAGTGRLHIVKELLASGTIHDNARGLAVIGATKKGCLDIVKELLGTGTIPLAARRSAQQVAKTMGNRAIANTLGADW